MKEFRKFLIILFLFLLFYFIPFDHIRVQTAFLEGLAMLQDYARLHVLLCLVPAFLSLVRFRTSSPRRRF